MMKVQCNFCARECLAEQDDASGSIWCSECGKVVRENEFQNETFEKGPGNQTKFQGNYVNIRREYKRALENGKREISDLMHKSGISDGSLGGQANTFYKIALEKNFTRGRRTSHVAAACLYTACRANDKAYMLIDFAMCLTVNVYVLGAVYLQICKLLCLSECNFFQKPVDPSLFMHRFASALVKDEKQRRTLGRTALKIVASMKRDWMQTGRKPSGICGAALYISCLAHGFNHSKLDVVKSVHICEATLTKRLVEFENTSSGSLTIEEFDKIAEEFEKDNLAHANSDSYPKETEVLCQHKGKKPHFACGLCENCYKDFIELSGGLNGGSEPPAFQKAELERLSQPSNQDGMHEKDPHEDIENFERSFAPESATTTSCEEGVKGDESAPAVSEESDNFADIDDNEIDSYFLDEEAIRKKTCIWEELNKEYVQEQAAKEAAIAAACGDIGDVSEEVLAAKKLAAATAISLAKAKEERKKKRALESKNAVPAKTAAEATMQMLHKKKLSSKINYDVLKTLFEETPMESTKKRRTDDPNDSGEKEGNEEEADYTTKDAEYEEEEYPEEDEIIDNYDYYNDNAQETCNYDDYGEGNWDD